VTEALDAWAGTLKPSDFSAMAGLRVAQHLNLDSQPGDPSSPVATNAHVEAMVSAVNSLLRGEPVNVPAAAIITPERAAEIETAAAKIDVEADAMQIRADEARVVDMETAARIDAQVAELRAQATATRQQGAGFVTNPVRDAENQAMVATMAAQAARIADQEGLPRAPYIVEPVATRVTRDLIAAGRSPEEAALTAKLVGLAMESTAKTAKMDPDVLFDQHYGGMTSRTGEPAEPALNQKAYRPRPADYIAEHKPTRMRDKASGLPGFKNQHMAMAGTEAMGGPQIDGSQRYSWRLYDLTNGRATKVGFVIADMRPDGSFKALLNIKIEDALQGMGMGEKTVASMLAHNGAKRMDIVDITSAGHVGTDLDALPFWKAMGTQLVNISSDPNVPMNGILSLEDYLRARSIHGPGNRNQDGDREIAQGLAGAEPGGGSGRGGPAGGGTAAPVVRQPRAGYGSKDPYTGDLFGDKLPIPARAPAAAASAPGATPLRDTPATPGTYHVNTRITSAGERQIGATAIKDDRDLAQATAYLYKSAVERFDAIVTDKDGKPLAVVGSFKGAIGQTAVYPSTLMAEAIRVDGAAKIWFSHNHPSGNASLSRADSMLHQTLVDVFKKDRNFNATF